MTYLRRKIDSFLDSWKENPERKPLILKGARQIGKTESIRHFGKTHYKSYIEINFVTEPKYKTVTEDGYRADSIIRNISRIDPQKQFPEHETLIVFDEVQEYPEITTALKFFREDGRYDVICSGSLLGIQYKRIESISVGNKTDYVMHAMDFEEFLWANGYEDADRDILKNMLTALPFSETQLYVYGTLFLNYCILGGMPEVVKQFTEKKNFEDSISVQRDIVADYKEDIRKYAEGIDQTRIIHVFNRIVPQLGKDNKKFQISKVSKGARFKNYFGCIDWLVDAGIVNRCYCMQFPELPLKGNYDDGKYKLYLSDTGLLVSMLDDEEQDDLRANKNLGTYKGALYENIMAEALVKQGYDLFYYKKENSRLEEDFFIRTDKELLPVEVKATTGKSKSLSMLIKSEHYKDIAHGLKFHNGNMGYEKQIVSFPLFCAFLLRRWCKEQALF